MITITSHVLDVSSGKPAPEIEITLLVIRDNSWQEIGKGITNENGRITDILNKDTELKTGIYKMKFDTGKYFSNKGIKTFYPFAEVVFEITADEHYHIPLLLSPFGYSTYRGS